MAGQGKQRPPRPLAQHRPFHPDRLSRPTLLMAIAETGLDEATFPANLRAKNHDEDNMNPIEKFQQEVVKNIEGLKLDRDMTDLSRLWLRDTLKHRYTYNFSWLGRPIIQYPQDMVAIQELIWQVKPDLIIETGIAHGGSLILSASMLALLDYCDAIEARQFLNPEASQRRVLELDVDIKVKR